MHTHSGLARIVLHSAIVALIAITMISSCGCYERVVGAEGVGADRYDVYEPNLQEPDQSVNPKRQTVKGKSVPAKSESD